MSSSKTKPVKRRHTLAFRLSLWYAAVFTFSSAIAFLFFYLLIATVIRERTDQELTSQITSLRTLASLQGI